jgi:Mce-associated membrane protein
VSAQEADEGAAADREQPEGQTAPQVEEPQVEERQAEERQAEERQAEERQAEEPQAEEPQAEEPQAEERQAKPSAGPSLVRGVAALPRNAAAGAGRLSPRWRIASLAVLGVLAVGAVVSAVLLAVAAHHDDVASRASTAARQAATTEIQQILSYDYRSLGPDLARAKSDTTGQFTQQFEALAGQIIVPAATQQQTVTRVTVPNASVVSATANRVVVLLFIDQNTTNKARPQPQRVASQVRVTMQQARGHWLVAQFQAL